jgi:hypothetical protein
MKITFVVFCFLAATLSAAESDFEKLQRSYREELSRVQSPVHSKYKTALEKLKDHLSRAGDVDGAKEVSEEIVKIDELLNQKHQNAEVLNRILNTRWQWWEDQVIEFFPEGRAYHSSPLSSKSEYSWEVEKDGTITLIHLKKRDRFKIELSAGNMKFTAPKGNSWHGKFLGPIK